MRKHNGMRPQDVVILLKIAAKGKADWYMKDLAYELGVSQSEVSESLHRSALAGLLATDKRTLMKGALLEFLQHGLRYVYPQKPGAITRGMTTAHSAPPLLDKVSSQEVYVWPWAKGQQRGQCIEPLHPSVPDACQKDTKLHELLALADAMRVGKAREQKLAAEALRERL